MAKAAGRLKVTVATDEAADDVDVDYDDADFAPVDDAADIFGAAAATQTPQQDGDDVTFRVTMDERQTERSLYGRATDETDAAGERRRRLPIGLDMTTADPLAPETQAARVARARRFGAGEGDDEAAAAEAEAVTVDRPTEPVLRRLYEQLGVAVDESLQPLPRAAAHRLDSLLVRGVDLMSSYDINKYFAAFFPDRLEWVNDGCCKVVWSEAWRAAAALLALTRPARRVRPPRPQAEPGEVRSDDSDSAPEAGQLPADDSTDEPTVVSRIDDDVEMADDVVADAVASASPVDAESMPTEPAAVGDDGDDNSAVEVLAEAEPVEEAFEPVDVDMAVHVVPPGKWRVAVRACEKAALLLMRFSTARDVKAPGAHLHSAYYRQHGNPNLAGLHGLVSRSLKRRLAGGGHMPDDLRNRLKNRWMNRDKIRAGLNIFGDDGRELEWDYEHDTRFFPAAVPDDRRQATTPSDDSGAEEAALEADGGAPPAKRPLMRMRADDEQQRQRRQRCGADALALARGGARRLRRRREQRWRHDRSADEPDEQQTDAPTPQPWDPPTDVARMKVTFENERAAAAARRRHARKRPRRASASPESSDETD